MTGNGNNRAAIEAYEELAAGAVLSDLDPIESSAERTHAAGLGAEADRIVEELEQTGVLVAAALAEAEPIDMPDHVTESLQRAAGEFVRAQREGGTAASSVPTRQPDVIGTIGGASSRGPSQRAGASHGSPSGMRPVGWAGWFAAAACLAIAVGVWRPSPSTGPSQDLSALAYQLEQRAGVATATWQNTVDGIWPAPEAANVQGGVVWSPESQEGYLRLTGLPVNDPSIEQYQLWIVDAERGIEQRIDGGVFNVESDGEVVVPIDARVPVGQAFAFAITIERPGGVVVSDMTRRGPIAVVGG